MALGVIFLILWISASGSCIWLRDKAKSPLIFIFQRGSSAEELASLTNDMKTAYPGLIIKKTVTEEGAFNEAVRVHNIKPENVEQYRKALSYPYDGLPTAEMDIQASPGDLVSEENIKSFLTREFGKYKSLKLRTDSGSDNDRIARFFEDSTMDKQLCVHPGRALSVMALVLLGR